MAHEEVCFLHVLEQVESLKQANLWPFKQLKPQVHPPRPKVLWDYLLEEMEWLAEDVRQERVWKKEAARNIANWVMDWHDTADKSLVCVKTRPIVHIELPLDKVAMKVDSAQSIEDSAQKVFKAPIPVDPKLNQVDPKTLEVFINPLTNQYMLKDNNPLQKTMAHIPALERPKFAVTDQFIESTEKIVPVSKFMAADYVVKDMNRFDSAGKNVDGVDVAPPVKRLAALKTYEDQPIPGAMFKKTEEDSVPQPKIAKPEPPRPIGTWTSDEEDALWNLVKMYSFNWPLVAETINATRLGNGNIARTEWCCFNKYIELRAKQFTPHSKGDYLFSSSQTNKKEKKVKVLGMLSTFNYISNLAKKRENARPPAKSNKQVNLTSHETHTQAQIQAGIDVNNPPLGPTDLVRLKEQRDKLIEQTRQNAFYGARPMMQARPMMRPMVRPPTQTTPTANVPIAQVGFRPAFQGSPQPQMQRMGMGYTPDQIQKILLAQQQRLLQQQGRGGMVSAQPNLMPTVQNPTETQARPRNTRMQADMSTAAAFVALQNAQNATKIRDSQSDAGSESIAESSIVGEKPVEKKRKKTPARRASGRRTSRIQISESESEEDELVEEEEEDELEETESEPEAVVKPTRSRRSSRSNTKKRK